jgi:tetratricopeptide (TPR) repeat protein
VAELVARGDAAWDRRADGSLGGEAAAEPIGEAVSAYERALEASPDSVAIRTRLLRALYFQGRFASATGTARRAVYARGRDLAEEGIAQLAAGVGRETPFDPRAPEQTAAALGGRPESVALFFWAAGHWGLWGETSGAFAAARQGVAGKVRDYAEIAILIDERYESGGGLRIRGRLHTEAPRIPLVTGWVDRELAVRSLERAVQLAPLDPLNQLYLADALLRFRPARRAEAVTVLEELLAAPPRPGLAFHDESTKADARRLLAQARSPSSP